MSDLIKFTKGRERPIAILTCQGVDLANGYVLIFGNLWKPAYTGKWIKFAQP